MSHELAERTWQDVRDLDRARAVVVLPVGAIEAHGPHLPLGTDGVIAAAMAREGAARLAALGVQALVMPGLPFTAAPFAAEFSGTFSVSAACVTGLVAELAMEATRNGFAAFALANAHFDPTHVGALRDAVARAHGAGSCPVVFPDVTRRANAARLGEEFRTGACHAGRYEGSLVMAERPDLVRDDVRRALPANPASLSDAIRAGRHTFSEAGGPAAYFGWPADATVEEGVAMRATLGDILAEAVMAALAPGHAS